MQVASFMETTRRAPLSRHAGGNTSNTEIREAEKPLDNPRNVLRVTQWEATTMNKHTNR